MLAIHWVGLIGDNRIAEEEVPLEDYEIPLGQIERARTVYQWAPLGKPSPSRGGSARSRAKSPIVHERILTS